MNFLGFISRALAAGSDSSDDTTIEIDNPLCSGGGCTIMGILEKISLYLLWVGAPIATIMIIYGAFQILTAGGKPEQAKKGGQTILYAAIGYGIILVSWGVVSLVKELLGVTT